MSKFKQNTLIIPKFPSLKDRNRNIKLMYNGHNAVDLSITYGCSVRTIYRIVNK